LKATAFLSVIVFNWTDELLQYVDESLQTKSKSHASASLLFCVCFQLSKIKAIGQSYK
jgi:hypothetical protein